MAPTYKQGRLIAWGVLKNILKPMWNHLKINESNLTITLPNDAEISIKGSDKADSLRGSYLNRIVLDEYAYQKPGVWSEIIFPMLGTSKPLGEALFIGTPSGFNHFYELYSRGKSDDDDWNSFQYTTLEGGYVLPEEIARAKKELDPRSFAQEYQATFENYGGNLYYTFDRKKHVKKVGYNPDLPIYLSCDFNKDPMCWIVAQQIRGHLNVIDEIAVRYSAKTQHAVEIFINRYKKNNKVIYITGDSSNNYESHRDFTTDYIIIEDALRKAGLKPVVRVPRKNPNINNRINVICSLLSNERISISEKCDFLIRDLEINQSDNRGGKDKTDPMQTHASDSFDYLTWGLYSSEFYKAEVKQI